MGISVAILVWIIVEVFVAILMEVILNVSDRINQIMHYNASLRTMVLL